MTVLRDPRSDLALEILNSSFGQWSNAVANKELSETLPAIYDACVGDADEEPIHRMGNAIWNWYSGGTACHAVAGRIYDEWTSKGLA